MLAALEAAFLRAEKCIVCYAISSDNSSANGLAERGLHWLQPRIPRLRIKCHIHKLHTIVGKLFQRYSDLISGIIAFGLSMRKASRTDRFRRILQEVLQSRARFIANGTPPPKGSPEDRYRSDLLDVCIGPDSDAAPNAQRQRRLQLQMLLAGDWRKREIEVYLPGEKWDLESWSDAAAHALLPHTLGVLPRNRWCSSQEQVQAVILLLGCHDVLSESCAKFCGFKMEADEDDGIADGNAAMQIVAAPDAPAPNMDLFGRAFDASQFWREFNHRQRQSLCDFAQTCSFTETFLMMTALEPLADFLRHLFHLRSSDWEEEQLEKVAETGSRSFLVVMSHTGELTQPTWPKLEHLFFHADPWDLIPYPKRTSREASLAFSTLCAAGGGLHFHFRREQSGYPYLVFALLLPQSPDELAALGHRIINDPPCLKEPFTEMFTSTFPTVTDITSTVAIGILACIATALPIDIADIECRHAWIRRQLQARSATWAAEKSRLSADFLLMQWRGLSQNHWGSKTTKAEPEEAWKSHGGGGPCRAYFSEALRRGERDYTKMHQDYAQIKAENGPEYQELLRIGRAATTSARAGTKKAFGQVPNKALPIPEGAITAACTASPEQSGTAHDCLVLAAAPPSYAWLDTDAVVAAVDLPGAHDHETQSLQVYRESRKHKVATEARKQQRRKNLREWASRAPDGGLSPLAATESTHLQGNLSPAPFSISWVELLTPVASMIQHAKTAVPAELLLQLRSKWEQSHVNVATGDTVKLADVPKEHVTKCRIAGFCICDDPELKQFVKIWQQRMRSTFKKGSFWRENLDMGMVVIKLEGSHGSTAWYHISYPDLSSWEVSLLPMALDEDPMQTEIANALGLIALFPASEQLATAWVNVWSAFRALQKHGVEWSMTFHGLVADPRQLQELVPAHVLVHDLMPDVVSFWPPTTPHRRRRQQKRKRRQAGERRRVARAPAPAFMDEPPLADDEHDSSEEPDNSSDQSRSDSTKRTSSCSSRASRHSGSTNASWLRVHPVDLGVAGRAGWDDRRTGEGDPRDDKSSDSDIRSANGDTTPGASGEDEPGDGGAGSSGGGGGGDPPDRGIEGGAPSGSDTPVDAPAAEPEHADDASSSMDGADESAGHAPPPHPPEPSTKVNVGVGQLRYRPTRGRTTASLDAHCKICKCKTDKKAVVNRAKPVQGRPMGYLLLFLSRCPGTKAAHRAWLNSWRHDEALMYPQRSQQRREHLPDPRFRLLFQGEEREFIEDLDDEIGEPILLP